MEEIIFPNQIRMYRRVRGRSMQELADFLGVSLSAVSKIEKGYRRIDQEQLVRIAEFLDCPLQDIFVNESSSQADVVQAWRREQERRNRINERSGLKMLGAGLRYIRGQKNLTLSDVADGAELTLSVYHRIEMGQREVSEDEISRIARALGYTNEELQKQIYDLDKAGALEEFIQRNDTRTRAIANSKYNGPDLPVVKAGTNVRERSEMTLSVYGQPGDNGSVIIDTNAVLGTVSVLAGNFSPSSYAVLLCTRRLGNLLPTRAILVVDPNKMVGLGDLALVYDTEQEAHIVSVREDMDGKMFGVMWNPDEKIEISEAKMSELHRVVQIILP
ncbi:MAG: helix-turn-helix domain-containing protein [Alphaproteobacteria bacterium]|nr:helix-turn-helix domain-containing protein [Alphaproteobacteria bacterium]